MTDIFINGEIGGDSWDGSGEWGIIGTKFVQNALAEITDKEVLVHINSPGGEVREGYAIHDTLRNSGKEISTVIEGNCSSIATVVLLAAEKGKRGATENSTGMIHNPWTISIGNSDELQEDVDKLKEVEDELLDFYVDKTGASRDELEKLMAEEKELSSAELQDLGFIDNVTETNKAIKKPNKIFAKAYYKRNMKNDKETKTIQAMLEGFYTKLKALAGKTVSKKDDDDDDKNKAEPRAEEQQLEDGSRIFINGDEGNWSGKEVWLVGEDGSLGDALPDGDHTLGDGRGIRISGGTISEVLEEMEAPAEDPAALKNQVAKLQAEIKRMGQTQISDGLERQLQNELALIKQQVTSVGQPNQHSPNFTTNIAEKKTNKEIVFDRARKRWGVNSKKIKTQ